MFGNGGTGPTSSAQIQMVINSSGNVGIGTSSPTAGVKLDVRGKIYVPDHSVQAGAALIGTISSKAMFGSNSNSTPIMISRDFSASYPDISINTDGYVGMGLTDAEVRTHVHGPLLISNNTGGGVSQTHTNMSVGESGKLIINFASIGTMLTGDTIVFTYAALNWKSWFFKIRWSSTVGQIGELWAGGYNNNSDGYEITDPYAGTSGTSGGVTRAGMNLQVSRSGQGNTMTLTLTGNHVHPLFEIEYSCGGGEGYPKGDRASITVNS
jgi:hypothetical protein